MMDRRLETVGKRGYVDGPAADCYVGGLTRFCEFQRVCVELLIAFPGCKFSLPAGYELTSFCDGQWTGVLTAGTCAGAYDERSNCS